MVYQRNRMSRTVEKIGKCPSVAHSFLLTWLFSRFVPFLKTAGLRVDEVSQQRLVVSIRNQRKVQNHIQGLHAAAMALLAETATGFVMGMNVPDNKLILLKSMKVDYFRRSQGNMHAVATLSPEQIQCLHEQDKGNTTVEVIVIDQSGESPIVCQMVWAWILKKPNLTIGHLEKL